MITRLPGIVALLALGIFAIAAGGCGGILGDSSSPTPTFTPSNTPTPTDTPTPTTTATPTATATPALPANPDALQRWDDVPFSYCVVATDEGYVEGSELVAAVERAFAAWGVPAINAGGCDSVTDDDDLSQIGWGDLSGRTDRGSEFYEAGLTSVRYEQCTSGCDPDDPVHIVEADIIIDAAPPADFRSGDCLYSTLLHETGHFLGLTHLEPPAVMAPETTTCPDVLTEADRQALFSRYGPVAQPGE